MPETTAPPATRQERLALVRQFVAERLFLKPENVAPHSRLIADMGADSLDFVDLQFHLERLFDVRFQEGEFFDFTFRWVTPEGYLHPEVVERISPIVPGLKELPDQERISLRELFDLVTVETLVLLVEQKLGEGQAG
jgi:acyl carrier protein